MNATDFNRHAFPPGGWQFLQPQTGWRAPTPTSSTFDQTVQLIRKHRMGNPAAVSKYKLSLNQDVIGNELETFNRTRLKIPLTSEAVVPKPQPLRQLANVVGAVAVAAKKAFVGIGVLHDWLGDGLAPVSQPEAEARAARCVQCPQNSDPNWLQKIEAAAADAFRVTMEAKSQLLRRTSQDSNLHSCQVCDCHLQLKVWVPIKHILGRTRPEQMAKLKEVVTRDGKPCWIVEENK